MPGPFALDFFILVLLISLGVLQMAAAYSSLWGLLLVRKRILGFLIGLTIAIAAFAWFYLSEPRNVPDTEGGLDGNQVSALFAAGAGAAVLITLLLSSLVNRDLGPRYGPHPQGLDALRHTSYLRALRATLRSLWGR